MKIGVVLENNSGMNGNVCAHFGQCQNFFIVDIAQDGRTIEKTQIVPNNAQHGGGGCVAVDEILKHGVTHVIAGGMGMGAQQKFASRGVRIFGFEGKVQEAIDALLKDSLGGLSPCREHGSSGSCNH